MRTLRFLVFSCLVISVGLASNAQAAIVTVGSPLIGSFSPAGIGTGNTLFNKKGPPVPVSPATGAVIGWNITGAEGGPYYLRLLTPVGTTEFTGAGKSGPATPLTTGVQHFATLLPIKAGQMIAFDHTNSSDKIGILAAATNEWGFFPAALGEGATGTPNLSGALELGFNAEVQPAPIVLGLATTAGPMAGGTAVLVSGTDLEGTTSVKFGGAAAVFGQVSETAVLATSPASASAGSVPISVTTRAGTGISSQLFNYQAPATPPPAPAPVVAQCVVPSVVGKHLKAAKKKIRAAHCTIGHVGKNKGVTTKTGKVVKQSPKAGATKKAGSKVNVTLG